jgi:cellulose biosynthesis protein BcsQ
VSIPILTFFNNKGRVGATWMVYHVAHMFADCGVRVLTVDLDPQCNLTAAFVNDIRLEELWPENGTGNSIFDIINPLKRGTGDIKPVQIERINDNISLVPGDIALSEFEGDISDVWPRCLGKEERAFRVISAFWRVIQDGIIPSRASVVLVDLGPNLGAINRAAMIASTHVLVPLAPDLFSLQGLRNLGPTLRKWRDEWKERLQKNPDKHLILPGGEMEPIGYIVMQHSVRQDRPAKAYEKWISRIPSIYQQYVIDAQPENPDVSVSNDPLCFGLFKHYRSLMPMAQEARKPVFHLKPADGAFGSHTRAVESARADFEKLTRKIAEKIGVKIPG